MNTVRISLTINGVATGPHEIPAALPMIDYLHEYCGLTGTKFGCGIGACRACVIIWDHDDGTSEAIPTCITAAASFDGKRVRTIEGHAADGQLTALQQALLEHFAFQCGYCTAGMIVAATALLRDNPRLSDEQIVQGMNGNVCRCGTYPRVLEAIRNASHQAQTGGNR